MARWTPLALLIAAAVALPAQAGTGAEPSARAKAGVKAEVKRGTLRITGNRRANKVTLRLKRRRRGILEVDAGSNGKADFTFRRKRFKRIAMSGGRGNDTFAISERYGSFVGSERTTLDGGRDNDRLVFTGTRGGDSVALSRRGRRLRLRRGAASAAAAANVPVSGRGLERLTVTPAGGADVVTVGNLARTGVREATLQLGSRGQGDGAADRVLVNGTAANDFLSAAVEGTRVALAGLGPGVAAANVEPADRLTLDGLGGADTLHLAGTPGADDMAVSAAGGLTHATVGATTTDSDGFETLRLEALAGADTITVGDLGGTDTGQVVADLGASGGGAADGQTDDVTVTGRAGADTVALTSGAPGISISGLAAGHTIAAADPVDRVTVNGAGGADSINSTGVAPNAVALTLRGGPDADVLTGGPSAETFAWLPGDGADVAEGGTGGDTASVTGSSAAENFSVAPAGGRLLIMLAGATLFDTNGVETARLIPAGGADTVTVPDLTASGTELTGVTANLGGSDGAVDNVLAAATNNPETISLTPAGGGARVALAVPTTVTGAAIGEDTMTIQALGGNDLVDASLIPAGVVDLLLQGGLGLDIFIGSQGNDFAVGGDGDDTGLLGAGNDTFQWNPGDDNDVVEGQSGSDRLLFNGANVAEMIDIAANGGRMRFFRNVANVTMDCNDVETVDFNALGGADSIAVNDLSGTDVTRVNLNLAATGGAGDAQVDTVLQTGTAGNDVVSISGGPGALSVTGLPTALSLTGTEPTDSYVLSTLGGGDTVDARAVRAGAIALTVFGGFGNDLIFGGDGNDTLNGEGDVDELHGGPGTDVLNGGGQVGDVEDQG